MIFPLSAYCSFERKDTAKTYARILFPVCICRVIRELEAQLEYEREKREKLEAQMDKLRAQIHTLTLQLEDERGRHVTAVGTLFLTVIHSHVEIPCRCGHEDLVVSTPEVLGVPVGHPYGH